MTNIRKSKSQKVEFVKVHDNTSIELINITSDKLRVILLEHLDNLQSANSWHTPLSLLITIILVFCTSTFKDAMYLTAENWKMLFIIGGFFSVIWLAVSIKKWFCKKSLEQIISLIQNKP